MAAEATRSLLHDFDALITQADRLLHRYYDATTLLMNRSVIAEAANSVARAREVAELTRLTFVFIPLSFTATFSGMNVRELSRRKGGDGRDVPLWLWVAFSAPVLLASLGLMH